jgi:hypothetical protein
LSLIGEALKRARLEAARREGEERGTAHSSVPAYLPARRRSRAGWIAATVVAALAGAGVVYMLLAGAPPSTPESSTRPTIPESPRAMPAAAPSSPVEAPSPPLPPSRPVSPPASEPSPVTSPPAPPAAPASTPVEPAKPAVSEPAPPGARVYTTVAQLGAARLELDGIVASPTDPVVMINRKLLGIGEGIEGWVVEKIETKQVTLRGGNQVIVLRLR